MVLFVLLLFLCLLSSGNRMETNEARCLVTILAMLPNSEVDVVTVLVHYLCGIYCCHWLPTELSQIDMEHFISLKQWDTIIAANFAKPFSQQNVSSNADCQGCSAVDSVLACCDFLVERGQISFVRPSTSVDV